MAEKPYYWNDDTQVLSLGGCPGHDETDIFVGELIPAWYPKEYEEKFDKFCQNQQISSKKNVTFTEKQTAKLVNAQGTLGKLRARVEEKDAKIKGLEKQVNDFEVRISQVEVLEGHKEELERLKVEIKEMGESFAALKTQKAAVDSELKTLGDEKSAVDLKLEELEPEVKQLKAEKQYLIDAFKELEKEKAKWESIKGNKKELEKLLKAVGK